MIERRQLKQGYSYKVRYWQAGDGRERSKTFKTLAAARAFERETAISQSTGSYVDPARSRITVAELWVEYMTSQEQRLKAKTRAGYQFEWKRRIEPTWGAMRLDKVTHAAVVRWVGAMGKDVGASSVRYAHRCLSLALDFAVKSGRLSKNPAKDVPLPRLEPKHHVYLTVAQVEALASECGKVARVYGDVVRFGAYTGARAGEVTALRVMDVSLTERRIRIRRNATTVSGKLLESTPKTKASIRTVAIPETLVSMLKRRTMGKEPGDLVFSAPTNARAYLRLENLRRDTKWAAMTKRLGIPGVTYHSLRHSFASLSRRAGADLRTVQKALGHSSITTTATVYADLFDDELTSVADGLDRLVTEHEDKQEES